MNICKNFCKIHQTAKMSAQQCCQAARVLVTLETTCGSHSLTQQFTEIWCTPNLPLYIGYSVTGFSLHNTVNNVLYIIQFTLCSLYIGIAKSKESVIHRSGLGTVNTYIFWPDALSIGNLLVSLFDF